MSFQFNFDIEETKSGPSESEMGPSGHTAIIEDKDVKLENGNHSHRSRQKQCVTNSDGHSANCVTSDRAPSYKPATEHKIPEDVCSVLESKVVESGSGLQFVNVSVVEMILSKSDVSSSEDLVHKSITSNSDLISGVYEGGMKIWECTFDLIRYIKDEDVDFQDKSVLDLGCGAGLLGIVSLEQKAKIVHFQDYNSTVIEEVTIPNVVVNYGTDDVTKNIDGEPSGKRFKKSSVEDGLLSKCRFFSGEWSSFTQFMQNQVPPMKYDVILTSETIYNPTYYSALLDVFKTLLASDGVVYLASKSHYFGVGGGVDLFENFVKESNLFNIHTLKIHDDGLQRALLKLDFRRDA